MKWIAISVLLGAAALASAQEEIILEKPLPASVLAGTVFDPTGAPLAGATVSRFPCPANFPAFKVLPEPTSSVKTDEKGEFSIPRPSRWKSTCLRFQCDGFNLYVVKVRRVSSAGKLGIKMNVAA